MQTPYQQQPVPSRPNNTLKWVLLGCGIPLLLFLLVTFGVVFFVVRSVTTPTKQTSISGAPLNMARYAGSWKGVDGTSISIRGDGRADFKAGGSTVNGGQVTIDEKAKKLSIKLLGLGKTWKLDKMPATANSTTMTLDGITYYRQGITGTVPN